MYRLPELIKSASKGNTIYIVEGEGKVDALRAIDVAATTCPGGASKWLPEMSEKFRDVDVVLLPDNDEAGWMHVNKVGKSLYGLVSSLRVLILPNLPPTGDVRDWLGSGGSREQLDELVIGAPLWQAPPQEELSGKAEKATAISGEQALLDELACLVLLSTTSAAKRRRANWAFARTPWIRRSERAAAN